MEEDYIYPIKILNEAEAAAMLQCSTRTLQRWRQQGIGPQYSRIGYNGPLRYTNISILSFLSEQQVPQQNKNKKCKK